MGISCFLGPQTVIEAGDASLSLMFVKLFGEQAGALPNVIALVAVLGGANGMVLATLRMPQSLALHHMMPCECTVSRMNATLRFPVASAMIALATTLFWVGVHTVVSALGLLPNGDISEIVVAMTMLILPLYYAEALRGRCARTPPCSYAYAAPRHPPSRSRAHSPSACRASPIQRAGRSSWPSRRCSS